MHLMILCRSLDYGGAQRQIVALARGLKKRGHLVDVVTFYEGGALAAPLAAAGVAVISLKKRGRADVAGFLWRFGRLLRRLKPDVIYSFLPVANLVALLARPVLPGCPIVWSLRGSLLDHGRYDRLSRLAYGLERRLAARANLVIANSEVGAAHAVAGGFPASNIRVVPNGIDTERFRPDTVRRVRLRAEWRIAPDIRLVGLVARLDPMKDVPLFLRAAALLDNREASLRFAIIGDGPDAYRAELVALASRLDLAAHLLWSPARDDIEAIYNALDLLVSSSAFGEGQSNVVAEAMASGTPVVVTDVGDAAAIVAGWGEVVPTGDAEALAAAIGRQLARLPSERELAGHGARRHIDASFSVAALADRTERLLLPLARSH